MIAFATLFLGLVVGVHPVVVVSGDEVARVEILLDGESRGFVDEMSGRLDVDFGDELAPRRLEAVAYDSAGAEMARSEQLVNLPQPPAHVSVLLSEDPSSERTVARLLWESMVGGQPRTVTAWFDGRPITVLDPRHIPLPPFDDSRMHLFSADLEFEGNVISQVMATFGGQFGEQVHTELTGLPVSIKGRSGEPPPVEEMRGWFLKDGESVGVVSVERGYSEVVFVLAATLSYGRGRPIFEPPKGRSRRAGWNEKNAVPLQGRQAVRFLSPVPKATPGVGALFNLYPMSPEFRRENGGLYWLLTRLSRSGDEGGSRRLADAVAVAGLAAYERHRRRAVVLLLGSDATDESPISAAQSRRYLERLKVPLFVWKRGKSDGEIPGWGKPVEITSFDKLRQAFLEVNETLSRQWIVWLDGIHLPQDVELSPRAKGVELLAAP